MRMPEQLPRYALRCVVTVLLTTHCAPGRPSQSPIPEGGSAVVTATSDATVTRDETGARTFAHVEELIEGRAPGVQVIRRSDGTFSLRIRGTTPPLGRNEPLIVIDGTPVFEQRVGQALAALTPQDVLRIDVLKDAASTALYGMRGGNGVIVITTRHQ